MKKFYNEIYVILAILVFIAPAFIVEDIKASDGDVTTEEMVVDTVETFVVSATVYNAVTGQCDNNPLRTADGSYIDKEKLNSGNLRWIAVSRDLLNTFRYGDKVRIEGCGEWDGIYEIHDTMNKKARSKIDILVPDHITRGRWRDVRIERVGD